MIGEFNSTEELPLDAVAQYDRYFTRHAPAHLTFHSSRRTIQHPHALIHA